MENIETYNKISASEFIKNGYLIYGKYVNNYRHIPWLFDGLKPVYRRVILSALKYKGMTKTITVASNAIMLYHPHGESINAVPGQLVRAGIFEGQGNFGAMCMIGEDIEESAPRYTEVQIKPYLREFFESLLPYVPSHINEYGNEEVDYLPTPLPLILTFGGLGIGIGTGFKSTAFTPKSLYEAYKADDPTLLRNAFGNEIVSKPEDLRTLWETGKGSLRIKLKVERNYDGSEGVTIEGNVNEFKPKFDKLLWYENKGRLIVTNLSGEVPKYKFSKMKRVWQPNIDEIHELVEEASYGSVINYLRVNYNECVYEISLRDWIDITYKNYLRLLDIRNKDEINKATHNIILYTHFRDIADKIINTNESYQSIADSLKVEESLVREVSSKSINTLRNLDPSSRIEGLKNKIKEYQNFNKESYIESVINKI